METEQILESEQPKKTTTLVVEEGGLEFVTPSGRRLCGLYPTADGVIFALVGSDERERLYLSVGASHACVSVQSAQSKAEARLWAGEDRASSALMNPAGENTAMLSGGGATHGSGTLSLASATGVLGAVVSIETEHGGNGGAVNLFSLDGTLPVATMSARRDGGMLHTQTCAGTQATLLGAFEGEGMLTVCKGSGDSIFTIPVHKMPGMEKLGRTSAEEASPEGEPEGAPRTGAV